MQKYFTTRKITHIAVFTALVFVATTLLSIPNGIGYTNLGDTFIFVAASYFDPLFSFLIASFGSMISDFALGYPIYAPFTFVIKGLEGLIFCILRRFLLKKGLSPFISLLISGVISALFMVGGYFCANTILYSIEYSAAAVLNDLLQGGFSLIFGISITFSIIKTKLFENTSDNLLRSRFNERHNNN